MKFSRKLEVQSASFLTNMYENRDKDRSDHTWAIAGLSWRMNRRPYLHVWPSMEKALLRSELKIDPGLIPWSIIHDLMAIEIRFSDSSSLEPFMLSISPERPFLESPVETAAVAASRILTKRIEGAEKFAIQTAYVLFGEKPEPEGYHQLLDELKIAIGVLMLAADPKYCEPMLLNRDKNKKLEGGDLEKAIERAKRNGKHGFDLGKSIEMSPHFRRPHFAIRWTGKGASIPKLVPVKGAIINKEILGDVPTGYEDDSSESSSESPSESSSIGWFDGPFNASA